MVNYALGGNNIWSDPKQNINNVNVDPKNNVMGMSHVVDTGTPMLFTVWIIFIRNN